MTELSANRTGTFLLLLLAVAFINSLYVFSTGWSSSLLDMHTFRQTQTALSIRELVDGGPWLSYRTPIFGPPWSVPFELPVYQWIVASLTSITGLGIEQSSRITSISFFYLSLVTCCAIMRLWRIDRSTQLCFLVLMLFSPIYLFWSRTCTIESTALFLALGYLYFGSRYLQRQRDFASLALAAIAGILAITTKVTTFFGFSLLLGFLTLSTFCPTPRFFHLSILKQNAIPLALILVFCCLVPLAGAAIWVDWSDLVKSKSPLTLWLLSSELEEWNFGSLEQRLSSRLWGDVIPAIFNSALGHTWVVPIVLVGALLVRRSQGYLALGVGLFLAVILTFTNLYIIHNYYAYACAVFIIFGVSTVYAGALTDSRPVLACSALASLIFLLIWSSYQYRGSYLELQRMNRQPGPVILATRDLVDAQDIVLIYGADWSPEIPYLIERWAIMNRDKLPIESPQMQQVLTQLTDRTIGGVLNCGWGAPIARHATLEEDLHQLGMSTTTVITHTTTWPPSGLACDLFIPENRL